MKHGIDQAHGDCSRREFLITSAVTVRGGALCHAPVVVTGKSDPEKLAIYRSKATGSFMGAAIGAAKAGANTLVLENQAFSGGVAAWGLGMCMIQMRPFKEPRGYVRVTQMKMHQIPYRALVPNQVDGLLAAGRCISATHEGASAGKSMGN